MVSPELIMVSPELIGMVSPELKWAILGAPYERLRSDMARQVEVFAQWSLRMPIEEVSGTGLSCHLVTFDAGGRERVEPDGELASHRALTVLAGEPVTDVFLFSHGWQGDVPAARMQYDAWIRAMADCKADVERMDEARGGAFRPLLIGLHWPSLPFGDEELSGGGAASFAAPAGAAAVEVEAMVDAYAARIADTPAAREALRVIIERAIDDVAPDELPREVADACTLLDRESGMGSAGEGAQPGADREPFDPERVYRAVQEEEAVSFGSIGLGGLLALPRTLSFWKMKDRARRFGEGEGHTLLNDLQRAAQPSLRFHVMGHSFGCIVASAMLAGPGGRGSLRPPDLWDSVVEPSSGFRLRRRSSTRVAAWCRDR